MLGPMRRIALAIAVVLLPLAAPAGERDGPPEGRLPLVLRPDAGPAFAPSRLIVNGFAWSLPGEVAVIGHDRVDLSRVPGLGAYVEPVLGPEDFGPGNAVGEVMAGRSEVILVVRDALADLPVSLYADLPSGGRTEFVLDARTPLGRTPGILAGPRIGSVHLVRRGGQRRLVAVLGAVAPYLLE